MLGKLLSNSLGKNKERFVFSLLLFAMLLLFIGVGIVLLIVWSFYEMCSKLRGKSADRTLLKGFFSKFYWFMDFWKKFCWNNPQFSQVIFHSRQLAKGSLYKQTQ